MEQDAKQFLDKQGLSLFYNGIKEKFIDNQELETFHNNLKEEFIDNQELETFHNDLKEEFIDNQELENFHNELKEEFNSIDIKSREWYSENTSIILYLDGKSGNDNNNGLSRETPLKTLDKALSFCNTNISIKIYFLSGGEDNPYSISHPIYNSSISFFRDIQSNQIFIQSSNETTIQFYNSTIIFDGQINYSASEEETEDDREVISGYRGRLIIFKHPISFENCLIKLNNIKAAESIVVKDSICYSNYTLRLKTIDSTNSKWVFGGAQYVENISANTYLFKLNKSQFYFNGFAGKWAENTSTETWIINYNVTYVFFLDQSDLFFYDTESDSTEWLEFSIKNNAKVSHFMYLRQSSVLWEPLSSLRSIIEYDTKSDIEMRWSRINNLKVYSSNLTTLSADDLEESETIDETGILMSEAFYTTNSDNCYTPFRPYLLKGSYKLSGDRCTITATADIIMDQNGTWWKDMWYPLPVPPTDNPDIQGNLTVSLQENPSDGQPSMQIRINHFTTNIDSVEGIIHINYPVLQVFNDSYFGPATSVVSKKYQTNQFTISYKYK